MKPQQISTEEIDNIANLARLEFTDEEKQNLHENLNQILDYVDQLCELDTEEIQPLSHGFEAKLVAREDKIQAFPQPETLMKNAPQQDKNYFLVPRVID
jgi:aspartyl-tRNA(Asn)/glutamyl-tRNA(Gln) amidotransferase subunit C